MTLQDHRRGDLLTFTDWAAPLVRMKESPEQEQYVRLAAENGQMKEVFAALDALGSTAWRINKSIYDVVVNVWNSGEPLGDIPMDQAERKLVYPVQPSIEAMEEPSVREAYRNQCRDIRIERAKHHSMRCTLNYKLEIAKAVSIEFLHSFADRS